MDPKHSFNAYIGSSNAVLLCAFNRPHLTRQVIESLRSARVPRLYFAVDGPRGASDICAISAVRNLCHRITWDCKLKCLFHDRKLGCGPAIAHALTWFFENEEQGIVLEDDILPSPCFFTWCDYFLDRFRGERSVQGVCGTHPVGELEGSMFQDAFDLSRYFFCWGWASWRDRMNKFNISADSWKENEFRSCPEVRSMGNFERHFWTVRFRKAYAGEFGTWDYQLMHQSWVANRLWLVPRRNLVSNIGFGPEATHTTDERMKEVAANERQLQQQLQQASDHRPTRDLTREAVRFLEVYNRDWVGVGNVLAESELHDRLIALKKKVFELESLLVSPAKLVKHIIESGLFKQWRL